MGAGKSVIRNRALKVEWELVRLTWVSELRTEIIFLHPPPVTKHPVSTQCCIVPSRYTEGNSIAFGVSPTECSCGHAPEVQCGLLSPQFPSWLCVELVNAETGSRKPPPSSSMFTLCIYICTYRGE